MHFKKMLVLSTFVLLITSASGVQDPGAGNVSDHLNLLDSSGQENRVPVTQGGAQTQPGQPAVDSGGCNASGDQDPGAGNVSDHLNLLDSSGQENRVPVTQGGAQTQPGQPAVDSGGCNASGDQDPGAGNVSDHPNHLDSSGQENRVPVTQGGAQTQPGQPAVDSGGYNAVSLPSGPTKPSTCRVERNRDGTRYTVPGSKRTNCHHVWMDNFNRILASNVNEMVNKLVVRSSSKFLLTSECIKKIIYIQVCQGEKHVVIFYTDCSVNVDQKNGDAARCRELHFRDSNSRP